jgi:hypothetical protein
VSSGTSERTSITVALMPSRARAFAASSARGTIAASATIVQSPPRASTFAVPSVSTSLAVGHLALAG